VDDDGHPEPAVIGAAQLRAARPEAWRHAAAAWRRLAETLLARADELAAQGNRLRAQWSGAAADAALARLGELGRALRLHALACLTADQVLAEHADRVAGARRLPDEPGARLASAADNWSAGRLRAVAEDFDGSAAAHPPALPVSADPVSVRRWWDALPEAERRALLVADPVRLGRLDGVPADVRDRANRLAFAQEWRAAGTGKRARLTALHQRLGSDEPARAYLLGFHGGGDGRAVIAIGNPDHAQHVLTYVPGTGSALGRLGQDCMLPAADRLAAHAGSGTAVVLWLGYDAPDNPAVAGSERYAERAGAALDRFQDGLRSTHDGERAHQTVLGHSYGSTVVGYTARDRGLDADDAIFVGSPGVGVAHASELGLPAGHVWASTAAHDPIRLTVAGRTLADVFRLPGREDGLWFGADPSGTKFGANTFAGAPGDPLRPVAAHVGYFDETNPALDAIVRITRR